MARSLAASIKSVTIYAGAYVIWGFAFRLLTLTILTYFLMFSRGTFQEISDAFAANELTLLGLSSTFYLLLLLGLYPVTTTTREELFSWYRTEKQFMPGFLEGAIVATALALAFVAGGFYEYVGFFIQPEEVPLAALNVVVRSAALLALAISEEYIFRKRILSGLRKIFPAWVAVGVTAVIYTGVKVLQLDLGVLQTATILLISTSLGLRSLTDHDFLKGAGFLSGVLLVLHPLFSLPVLGSEFQGVIMLRYQLPAQGDGMMGRLLTGGMGGPLASMGFQLVLLVDCVTRSLRNQKMLFASVSRAYHPS